MIRKHKGELIAECNECGAEYAGGCQDDFAAFVQELKDEDWQIAKEDDEWVHRCPSCSEK